MSDDELRALERRFRETRAIDDEAAWIGARVRSGELSWARVFSAALCGQDAALRASENGPRSSAEEIADAFATDERYVRRWVEEGCPTAGDRFSLPTVYRWQERRVRNPADRSRLLFRRTLPMVDAEAARLAQKLGEHLPPRSDDLVRRAIALWALAEKVAGSRFAVEHVELDDVRLEHRVVESGRVLLAFEQRRDLSHGFDPSFEGAARVKVVEDEKNLIVIVEHHDDTFECVVLPLA